MTVADIVVDELAQTCALAPEQIHPGATLIEVGLDSVRGINFLIALETHFEIEFPDDAVVTASTVEDVIRIVEARLAEDLP
jgi:acyl carrier protein